MERILSMPNVMSVLLDINQLTKRFFQLSIIFVVWIGTESIGFSSQKLAAPVEFDFGPQHSSVKAGAHLVTERTLYQTHTGFGLLGPAEGAFTLSDISLLDEMSFDGIYSTNPISFRVDLEAGSYWLEIFMAGGKRSLWQGEIVANGTVIADSLFQYGVSFEGEEPPSYWTLMRKVQIKSGSLELVFAATGQKTTVTGISIFKDDYGPLQLRDGKLIALSPLRAPNADLALSLLNRGATYEAQRLIDQIPERPFRYEKALLLLALAGRLEIEDPRSYIELAEKILHEEFDPALRSDITLNLRLAQLYIQADTYYKMAGWDWAARATGAGIFNRLNIAGHTMKKIAEVLYHPLSFRATFYLGRLSFWAWVEQHNKWQKVRADFCFKLLKPYYEHLPLLRLYLGEQSNAEDLNQPAMTAVAPEWVVQTNLALNSLQQVIHYWVDSRQAENGEFGGKFDDDVEMLRWWPIAYFAWHDAKTLQGMRRLVEGVWHSGWITEGFSTKVRDVEHSSEPVADTQPMMIGLDYGNPIYVERNMESMKGLRDVWTGINAKGHRHFRSSWYSYDKIDTRPPRDCDVELNTRTVKAARWLAWYNRHPFAMQFLTEWSDAWLEDCLRTDKGKPYGIVPAAIRYEDDAIGGHADNWHHPGLFWKYYDFQGGTIMMQQFLAMYQLTGEKKYLVPIEAALKLVAKYYQTDVSQAEVGSEGWVAHRLMNSSHFAETIELWRLLTGNSNYEKIVAVFGSDYLKFRLSGDKKYLEQGSRRIAEAIVNNWELITKEGYFTDRIEIGNITKSEILGANHLESMYNGFALQEGFFPFFAISYQGFANNFVAAVVEMNSTAAEVIMFNLNKKPQDGIIYFWSLEAGEYEIQIGSDINDDGVMESSETRQRFWVTGRNASQKIILPPLTQQLITVHQIKPSANKDKIALADLAITETEVQIHADKKRGKLKIVLPIHNIGIVEVNKFDVEIDEIKDGATELITQKTITHLEAPLDLEPRIVVVEFEVDYKKLQTSTLLLQVDAKNEIPEITEINNSITLTNDDKIFPAARME